MSAKATVRARWQQRRPKDPETFRAWSNALWPRLLASPLFLNARQVALFFARPWEPDLRPLWHAAPERCFYPRVDPATLAMTFYRVGSLGELAPGFARIPEPPADPARAAEPWGAQDLILIPGVAFDRQGDRIGSGLGCYDRFLAGLTTPKWAVAFSLQVQDDPLAQETTDVKMNGFCTELALEPIR